MRKVKKLFNKIAISFALLGTLTAGAFFMVDNKTTYENTANAEIAQYEQISNSSLQDYVEISSTDAGVVGNEIYLFNPDGNFTVQVGTDEIKNSQNAAKVNYGYYPDQENQPNTFYYFDFKFSISLYYNLTNKDIENGTSSENLLAGLDNVDISNFTRHTSNPFVPDSYSFTPQQLSLNVKLNSSNQQLSVANDEITLCQEGCYTLAIPVSVYETNNGITFTWRSTTIYYTFMVFNSDTYFDSATNMPRLTPSPNMQESSANASSAYSNYYFYNYAFGKEVNSLPTISYNPDKFQLRVEYTDIEQKVSSSIIENNAGEISQLNLSGEEIAEKDRFIQANINSQGNVVVTFTELGSYDISIKYLYVSKNANGSTTYNLPLEQIKGNNFENKAQKLYVYGYQAVFSDYADADPSTNQPKSKPLQTYDFETNIYSNSADITSALNKYIITADKPAGTDSDEFNYSSNAAMQNPTKPDAYNINTLSAYATGFITQTDDKGNFVNNPISSNQTPIKFLTNAKLDSTNSAIYKVDEDREIARIDNFSGFNQNTAGTYLYIVQYKFDSYLSTSGTLQSGYYHYQVFYFEITNTTPTITVYDNSFREIYTGGYTNKSVYILNDAENNIYDAEVDILISAYNYKTKNYFFEPQSIDSLSKYGMIYQKFEMAPDEEEYENYNSLVAGKYGILIENTNRYANALFTIQIKSKNTDKPSKRTFTIDTNPIENIVARNANPSTSVNYKIDEALSNYSTNKPFVLSWDEKSSQAKTYGYVKFVPMTSINYYSSLNEDKLAELLSRLISYDTLPVSYKLDVGSASNWSEYANAYNFTNNIPANYVKSNDGIYIFEIYDQAGNNAFEIILKDSTAPTFIEEIVGDSTIRKLISNGETISVPDPGIDISIKWTKNKAIYIEEISSYTSFTAYQYGIDAASATGKLQETLANFFDLQKNNDLRNYRDINVETTKDGDPVYAPTGIESYNGTYLIIPINEKAYLKEATSSTFKPYNHTEYKITFFDENDMALEGTYKILIRDESNSENNSTEELNYLNHPSGYLTFNVSSDASKLKISDEDGNSLEYSSYGLTGTLYSYKDDQENTHFTHISESESGVAYTPTDLTYKFMYNTPIKANNELYLSYIPVAENGSKLASIVLRYYPYKLERHAYEYTVMVNGQETLKTNYNYYYTIDTTPSKTINVFTASTKTYDQNQVETFAIALGTDNLPLAGRYVIERTYAEGNATDKYDYFKRTISFLVDDFSLISPLESITTPDGANSSLESVIGGDIVLSMYSGEGMSSIEVSFPSYNSAGLSEGSFYTKDSFTEGENLSVYSVEGNKLPMSLYVPSRKYTISNHSIETSNKKSYSVDINNDLSYYGYATVKENANNGMFDVVVENITVASFGTKQLALDYIENNLSIREYEIFAKIQANLNGKETRYYYSNGTTTNGFLNFYLGDKQGNIIDSANPIEFFYDEGNYVVTIYQSNNDPQSKFYSLYKFGFKIKSQEPDFTITNASGYELTTSNLENVYYTNSNSLTIEWQVPTSKYQAQIDEDKILINSYPSTSPAIRSRIEDGNGTRYFTLDTSRLIITPNSHVTITMQYQGYNSNYYSQISKTIYFDRSAPLGNLTGLMTLTEQATNSAFPVNYQQFYMRRYFDYQNQELDISNGFDIENMSYSYSNDSGYFKYFSFNVTTDFFNSTLKQTLTQASTLPYDTQYIYYKAIDDIKSYTQVDKYSFSERSYTPVELEYKAEVVCGYYEIVELDYAGNMTVYIVYVVDSSLESDENVNNLAISYINNLHSTPTHITNDQIKNGFNIYSNSGFELTNFSYNSDPWALINVTLAGQTSTRFMKSPWLNEGKIFKVLFSASGISFEEVPLATIFKDVESTSLKHQLVLTDRITGSSSLIYLSIMDASINTQKIEDPKKSSAILNISIPTESQYNSTTSSYAYPTSIKISQFDQTEGNWGIIMIADQTSYGIWSARTTPVDYSTALEYISFKTIAGNTLQVLINLGANASQKIMYEITDNFGNTSTVIQLANEVSYKEIEGDSSVYQTTESDNSITYTSYNTIRYSYNELLYNVRIFDNDGNEITEQMKNSPESYKTNTTTNIAVFSFKKPTSKIYDQHFKIEVRDREDAESPNPKVVHLRIVYNLPYLTLVANEVHSGGIIFNDRNQQPINQEDINNISSISVNFGGKPYTSSGYSISSYNNVTVRFKNGQSYSYNGAFEYQKGYPYSLYLSNDNGLTWENINSPTSAINGYTISGVGEYLLLAKYDDENHFTTLCQIFTISIIDQDLYPLYSVRVDNLPVERSNIKYTSQNNIQYEVNYIVSVNWADKDNRLTILKNEDKAVNITHLATETNENNVHVEIYHYESAKTNISGDFTIIYIEETNNIVSSFTYVTSAGTTVPLKDSSYSMIVANNETENSFDKLTLNFTSFYGIKENKINIEVTKLFNGSYVKIDNKVYQDGNYSYINLERAGSYKIKLYDSCTPANVQSFKGSEYIEIVFLNSVPFLVSHLDENGTTIITEPIQKAIYNSDVTIELTNLYSNSYYQPSGYPQISVTRNGKAYTGFTTENRKYTFSTPGVYTLKFKATSTTGIQIREEKFHFSIFKKNEIRNVFEFSSYENYYIEKVEKNGVDITSDLVNMGNYKTVFINGDKYLAGLSLAHSLQDEKTGDGRYKITINPNSNGYENVIGSSFTFELRIGHITSLPINISIAEGASTSENILVSFNVQNLYNTVGDCYIAIGDLKRIYTNETLANYGEVERLLISGTGTHYVEVYTISGRLLFSYKVIKTEPLNGFAIIAIVLGVIALGAIIGITIKIRKRQKAK